MQRAICINQLQKTHILILNFTKMEKIDLSSLSKGIASKKMMQHLSGGIGECGCACKYEGKPGGSTLEDNGQANYANGIVPVNSDGFILPPIIKG
jgi:hypothetical protein